MTEEKTIEDYKELVKELELKLEESNKEKDKIQRDSSGRFKKSTAKPVKEEKTEEIEPETPIDPDEKDKMLFEEIAIDLKKKLQLSDENYKTFEKYEARERVELLRALDKSKITETDNTGRGEVKDGASPPAPKKDEIPTLLELNDAKLYFKDLRDRVSYQKLGQRLRKANAE